MVFVRLKDDIVLSGRIFICWLVEKGLSKKTEGERNKKMKTDAIPTEEYERVELDNLPQMNILKAISEYFATETEDKTGGLIINFQQKDEKLVTQKYGKISGRKLVDAMEKLGLKDTEELQGAFYQYELTVMRSGYPRYIPIKVEK